MRTCAQCEQANPDEALFCHRCGSRFEEQEEQISGIDVDEDSLWRTFIGPSKTITFSLKDGWAWDHADRHYMETFKRFRVGSSFRFALTWHWPAFLLTFLWFLYRKMYMYAAVYLIGPLVASLITQDPFVGGVFMVTAGGSANYLYFWHIKDHLRRIREQAGPHRPVPIEVLRDAGGIQPYVLVIAVLMHLFALMVLLQGGPPQDQIQDQGVAPKGDPGDPDIF